MAAGTISVRSAHAARHRYRTPTKSWLEIIAAGNGGAQ